MCSCANTFQLHIQCNAPLYFKAADPGIEITYLTDGGVYESQCLKAVTKVSKALVRDLLYADDCAIVAHSGEDLQHLANALSIATKRYGLTIALRKQRSSTTLPQVLQRKSQKSR